VGPETEGGREGGIKCACVSYNHYKPYLGVINDTSEDIGRYKRGFGV
jgi:hypothetical protein